MDGAKKRIRLGKFSCHASQFDRPGPWTDIWIFHPRGLASCLNFYYWRLPKKMVRQDFHLKNVIHLGKLARIWTWKIKIFDVRFHRWRNFCDCCFPNFISHWSMTKNRSRTKPVSPRLGYFLPALLNLLISPLLGHFHCGYCVIFFISNFNQLTDFTIDNWYENREDEGVRLAQYGLCQACYVWGLEACSDVH